MEMKCSGFGTGTPTWAETGRILADFGLWGLMAALRHKPERTEINV